MIAFVLRRLVLAVPVLFIVLSLTFLLMRLAPGNPFATEKKFPDSIQKALEEKYNLDGSLWTQYANYIGRVSTGDLGISTQYRERSVAEIIGQALPVSVTLGSIAFVLAMGIGITLGSYAAVHHNTARDRAAMLTALFGISIPNFVLGPVLVLIFGLWWRVLPVAGWGTFAQLVLPAIVLSVPYAASIARLMRSSMLEVLGQDYVRTARAKGLAEVIIVYKHALKVAILPVVSYAGPLAAAILTGGIVVEKIFVIPGLGPFFVNSILNRDIFMVGGTVLVYAGFLIVFNIVVDILYFLLDRRVKIA